MLLVCNFTKNDIPPWVFFTLFKLCKWYQIAQNITYIFDKVLMPLNSLMFLTTTKFDLVRPGYFSNANVFENLWISWYHFLRSRKEGRQPSPVPPACYKAVDGSQEKDSVKGKSSHPDVSCKKNFQYLQANTCVGVF